MKQGKQSATLKFSLGKYLAKSFPGFFPRMNTDERG